MGICEHLGTQENGMRFMRLRDVMETTGLSRSSIYLMVALGQFPQQIKIGKRAVAWRQADIENWMLGRCK